MSKILKGKHNPNANSSSLTRLKCDGIRDDNLCFVPQGTFGRHRDLSAGRRDDKQEQARKARIPRPFGPVRPHLIATKSLDGRSMLRPYGANSLRSVQASSVTASRESGVPSTPLRTHSVATATSVQAGGMTSKNKRGKRRCRPEGAALHLNLRQRAEARVLQEQRGSMRPIRGKQVGA